MKSSDGALSWRERVRCVAREFNQSLGWSADEMTVFEAPDRAIAVQIVHLHAEAAPAFLEAGNGRHLRRGTLYFASRAGETARGPVASRQIATLERTLEWDETRCIGVVCLVRGKMRQACVVHGISPEFTAELLREDMALIIAQLKE
jgi:hypothetical protein